MSRSKRFEGLGFSQPFYSFPCDSRWLACVNGLRGRGTRTWVMARVRDARTRVCPRPCTWSAVCILFVFSVRGSEKSTREADRRDRVARPLRGGWPFQLTTLTSR
eukprot:5748774-Prymnesium_polylepis.1